MVKNDIIRLITDTPSDWWNPLVIVPKKNNKLRLCVDLTKLNKHVKQPGTYIRQWLQKKQFLQLIVIQDTSPHCIFLKDITRSNFMRNHKYWLPSWHPGEDIVSSGLPWAYHQQEINSVVEEMKLFKECRM